MTVLMTNIMYLFPGQTGKSAGSKCRGFVKYDTARGTFHYHGYSSQWVRTQTFELGIMYMFLSIIIFITPCCTIICRKIFCIVYG